LIKTVAGIGLGQSMGAIFLLLCFPPIYKWLFYGVAFKAHLIIALYLLHQICDGSSQVVEGRTWFKIIEIKIRRGVSKNLAENFWIVYAISLNVQLILGQICLWSSLALTSAFSPDHTAPVILLALSIGAMSVVISKFILPIAYRLGLCS
jgi:hypothetical protein